MATRRTKDTKADTTRGKKAAGRTKKTAGKSAPRASRRARPGQQSHVGQAAVGSRAFKKAERDAAKVLKDPAEARKLRAKAEKKAEDSRAELGDALDDLQTLMRLMSAYVKGDYRELPKTTMLAAVGAVIYFVNPLD